MSNGLTPRGEAFLAASQLRESFEDMSAQEINALPMTDYGRIREAAGLPPVDPFDAVYKDVPPGCSRQAQEPQTAPDEAQHRTDFSALSMAEYGRVRDQLGIGRSPSARGLFDSSN